MLGVETGWGEQGCRNCTPLAGPWDPRGDTWRLPALCHRSSCSTMPVPAACPGFPELRVKPGAALLLVGEGLHWEGLAEAQPPTRLRGTLGAGSALVDLVGCPCHGLGAGSLVVLPSRCWEDASFIPGSDVAGNPPWGRQGAGMGEVGRSEHPATHPARAGAAAATWDWSLGPPARGAALGSHCQGPARQPQTRCSIPMCE